MPVAVQSQSPRAHPAGTASILPGQSLPGEAGYAWLEPLVEAFESIDLGALTNAALLDRVEVKYLFGTSALGAVLCGLGQDYRVLSVRGHRINRYRTLYFDTHDFSMYRRHLAGAGNRYKVRAREYVETGTTFLEVKHKNNKDRTIKSRIPTQDLSTTIDWRSAHFLEEHSPFGANELRPCIWNRYLRITLVHREHPERVTLDFDLSFEWQGRSASLPGIVVAEVKMERAARHSEFVRLMRQNRVRDTGFSKFCVGLSLLNPDLKQNRLRAKQRLLARIMQGNGPGQLVNSQGLPHGPG
jgi:hypothetical protein